MMRRLRAIYDRQAFHPGWPGIFVNPFYLARSCLRDVLTELAPHMSGRLLDVGCGSKPYRALFEVDEYVGLDIDNEASRKRGVADHYYDGGEFPFPTASFDVVLCNQVLEHVFNPDDFMGEISRTLRPGGLLLLSVPFVWDEHEQPFDYARYSSFGLRALLEKQGFRILQHHKLGADASTLFQLANAYLYKVSQGWRRPYTLLLTGTIMALINIMGIIAGKMLPGNPDLYLDHVVLAEKMP
ncbi:MAG: class I SAM-dependent methyltransferase [Pseudomonadota bacterium]